MDSGKSHHTATKYPHFLYRTRSRVITRFRVKVTVKIRVTDTHCLAVIKFSHSSNWLCPLLVKTFEYV
jgi:hypothetical protein